MVANLTKVCIILLGSPIDPSFELITEAYVAEKLAGQLPTCSLVNCVDFDIPDLPLLDFKYTHMKLLSGGDVHSQMMLPGVRNDPKNLLNVQETLFS